MPYSPTTGPTTTTADRDENGVLHITNTKRSPGNWKLWKSFPGSGGEGARARPRRRAPVDLGRERYHRYDSYISGAARRYQLPEGLVRAVIHTESNYNPEAVSSVGAMGPDAAHAVDGKVPGSRSRLRTRAEHLRRLQVASLARQSFQRRYVLVLAGYHAGAGAVQKYGGVPPYESTRAYVKAVLRRYYAYERQVQIRGSGRRRGPARHIAG